MGGGVGQLGSRDAADIQIYRWSIKKNQKKNSQLVEQKQQSYWCLNTNFIFYLCQKFGIETYSLLLIERFFYANRIITGYRPAMTVMPVCLRENRKILHTLKKSRSLVLVFTKYIINIPTLQCCYFSFLTIL